MDYPKNASGGLAVHYRGQDPRSDNRMQWSPGEGASVVELQTRRHAIAVALAALEQEAREVKRAINALKAALPLLGMTED